MARLRGGERRPNVLRSSAWEIGRDNDEHPIRDLLVALFAITLLLIALLTLLTMF